MNQQHQNHRLLKPLGVVGANAPYRRQILALDSAAVKIQKLPSPHGGHQHREKIESNQHTMMKQRKGLREPQTQPSCDEKIHCLQLRNKLRERAFRSLHIR